MGLAIDSLYTKILSTDSGDVPCAGKNGELGKYALISDIELNCNKLKERIETINTTGAYTPIMTTAAISAKFINDFNVYKKEFVQIMTSIVEAETLDIKDKTDNDNYLLSNSLTYTNTNIENCKNEIGIIYNKINNEIEKSKIEFETIIKNNDTLSEHIGSVEKKLYDTNNVAKDITNDVDVIKKDIILINETLNKENIELKETVSNLQSQITALDNQNKEIMKALLSINKKIRAI